MHHSWKVIWDYVDALTAIQGMGSLGFRGFTGSYVTNARIQSKSGPKLLPYQNLPGKRVSSSQVITRMYRVNSKEKFKQSLLNTDPAKSVALGLGEHLEKFAAGRGIPYMI